MGLLASSDPVLLLSPWHHAHPTLCSFTLICEHAAVQSAKIRPQHLGLLLQLHPLPFPGSAAALPSSCIGWPADHPECACPTPLCRQSNAVQSCALLPFR